MKRSTKQRRASQRRAEAVAWMTAVELYFLGWYGGKRVDGGLRPVRYLGAAVAR